MGTVTAPSPEDLDLAREDALLQLRIGRSSHYYSVLVSGALALDAFLILLVPPSLASGSWSIRDLLFLGFPIGSGIFLSVFGLRVKWEEYQLWPWELHFWVTVLAVVLNAFVGFLYVAGLSGYGPTASLPLVPWLLPLALGGLSAAMLGLALTWTSYSRFQWASLVAALLPVPFGFVLFLPGVGHAGLISGLATSLLACALFYATSGSLLHLISSGTRAHERELITTGQTRMFTLADELRRKESSLQLREAAALHRETALDTGELSLKRRLEAAEETRGHLDRMEQELRARSDALALEQRDWASKAAATQSAGQTVSDRDADLKLRERQLSEALPALVAREQRIVQKEGDVAQREAELTQLQSDLARRGEALRDGEARLDARRVDIDRRTTDLLRQESQLKSRESMLNASTQERSSAAQRLADLEARESRLNQLQITLDDLRASLDAQTAENARLSKALTDREEAHARAEASLATRATTLEQREAESASALKLADSRRLQYEETLKGLEARTGTEIARSADLDRKVAELQRREQDAAEALERAKQRDRQSSEREDALDRREAELKERARASGVEGPTRRPGPPESLPASGPTEEELARAIARRLPDRISTGAPRLDDLLLGGFPSKGHVVVLGPPFTGKEVLLYQFVGEGLKRGEPVILLTGGRTPAELREGIGPVYPDFAERDRRGMVLWIDASGPVKAASAGLGPTEGELAGTTSILSKLVQLAKQAESTHPEGFRVAALGLGHLFSGLDAARGAAFFQNFVGILKPRNALGLYTLDSGLLPEPLLGAVQARADGVIECREERGKTQLAVRGLGEVATRDWVEYRSTPQGLVLGSFSLERIR